MVADIDANNASDNENHEMNDQEELEKQKKDPSKYLNYATETFTSLKQYDNACININISCSAIKTSFEKIVL